MPGQEPEEQDVDIASYAMVNDEAPGQRLDPPRAPGKPILITGALRLPQTQWHQKGDVCEKCKLTFSVVRRKHHCRICGQLLCATCSNKKVQLPDREKGKLSRSCKDCFETAKKKEFSANLKRVLDVYEKQVPKPVGAARQEDEGEDEMSSSPIGSRASNESESAQASDAKALMQRIGSQGSFTSCSALAAKLVGDGYDLSLIRPTLVLFGDSLTEDAFRDGGWGSLLAGFYNRRVDVFNRGFAGYNTDWALRYLSSALKLHTWPAQPHTNLATVVCFGVNDVLVAGKAGQHVAVPAFKDNLRAMIKPLQSLGKVVLMTPPPFDEKGEPRWKNLSLYANAVLDLAEELSVSVVDCSVMRDESGWQDFFLEGKPQLSRQGNQWLFHTLCKVLAEGGLKPDCLPLDAPLYTQINKDNPQATFSPE
eukprot:gb/GEZN01003188.1/.p1 GENE.gb/GEZN01003188.1/~~gb/GEZN01003188.1/.p1  ORF type:complete len:423 (+),score=77.92 gb/GEZN01003188.1/:673-1941(+)